MSDRPPKTCSAAEIEEMMLIAAKAIEACGDAHLPLFEMLEREHAAMANRRRALDRARRLAIKTL